MIDIAPVMELTHAIESLENPLTMVHLLFAIMGLAIGAGFAMVAARAVNVVITVIVTTVVIFAIVGLPHVTGEYQQYETKLAELTHERISTYETQIKTASCESLRLHIIDMLENDYIDFIESKSDWVQDIYYHKCEIPLREEVMKLQ